MKSLTTIIIVIVVALCAAAVTVVRADEARTLDAVQSGAAQLQCQFSSGWQVVPTDKVIGFSENTWEFKNGYASNCQVF